MKTSLISLAALVTPALFATGLAAQDANTLNRHLENQQWQRLQDHQNRSRQMSPRNRDTQARNASARNCSADALPAADRRRMEVEYIRRARDDGRASADAWVREQGRQFRQRLTAEGVCSPQGKQVDAEGRSESGEQGCQMVMRPVAGLGGAPMTMAMVPDCGD